MSSGTVKLQDLLILNTAVVSNIWTARGVYEDAEDVILTGENVTDGVLTYTLEVTDDLDPTAASPWSTLQDAGADFVPPLQGKSKAIPRAALAATGIRARISAAATANRNFGASKRYVAAVAF